MNIEQVRDRIAELTGWKKYRPMGLVAVQAWIKPGGTQDNLADVVTVHPCPFTIDGVAALVPERYNVTVRMTLCASDGSVDGQPNGIYWAAHAFAHENDVDHDDAKGSSVRLSIVGQRNPAELEARTRLLLAVLEAEKTHAN